MSKQYFVYLITNDRNTVLYTGITSRLTERIVEEHGKKIHPHSFSARYNVAKLVHVEIFDTPMDAIHREKQIKSWSRRRKNLLVEKDNPNWTDILNKAQ
jgi:putative endonuclease